MPKLTKREKHIKDKVEIGKAYSVEEAIDLLKICSKVKFTESVDLGMNLGVDPRKSDQVVRGAIVLPNGSGRNVRVAVFAQGDMVDIAKEAGADIIGYEDLAEEIKGGKMDFNVLIATPDAMRLVGTLGPILGPRGLMPNPKIGTVTKDVATAVKNAKAGQVNYRTDKAGLIHCTIGKLDFDTKDLKENLIAVVNAVKKAKPSSSKGIFLKKITLSSTMGPGVLLDIASIEEV